MSVEHHNWLVQSEEIGIFHFTDPQDGQKVYLLRVRDCM